MGRKIAIVGTAPSSYELAPFEDPEWEIWGTSRLYHAISRWDVWFELHDLERIGSGWNADARGKKAQREKHLKWLKSQSHPIYVQHETERIPAGIAYPLDDVLAYLGGEFGADERYLTNHISYMLALAIYEARAGDVERIGVWGVDMALDCLAPETRVLTADLEWVPAGEIHEGDQILAFDEHTGPNMPGNNHVRQWRVADVLGRSVARRPSYRIHFEDGTEIVASAAHRWLTYGEHQMKWKRTDELVTPMHRPGRPTRVHRPIDTWQEDNTWEAGYLAAAFDGEGWITQTEVENCNSHQLTIGFSQRENAMADKFRAVMAMKGFKWSEAEQPSNRGGGVATRVPCIAYNLLGGRPELMRMLGQIRPRRLLESFDPALLGQFTKKDAVAVTAIEHVGEVETIGFTTSTRTMVVEGFASHNSEWSYQRPSCEYLIGIARGAGLDVYIPPESDLLKAMHLYGYESNTPFHYKIIARKKELEQRKTQLKNQQRQLQMEHAARTGQLGLIGELCENGIPDQMRDELNRYGEQLKGEQQEIKNRIAQVEGNIAGFRGALDNMAYLEKSWL